MNSMTILGRNLLGLTSAALLLGACQDNIPTQSRPCPAVKVAQDAAYLTRFAGEAEDLAETSFEARIARSASMCTYVINTETGETTIRSEISVEFVASRGPKNPDSAAIFKYQVGVTGPGNALLPGQQLLDVQIPFSASKVQNVAQDQVFVYTPLKKGETGDFYRIWLSLEVTPKELDYNRRNPQF